MVHHVMAACLLPEGHVHKSSPFVALRRYNQAAVSFMSTNVMAARFLNIQVDEAAIAQQRATLNELHGKLQRFGERLGEVCLLARLAVLLRARRVQRD
jgi:hypothetical protein